MKLQLKKKEKSQFVQLLYRQEKDIYLVANIKKCNKEKTVNTNLSKKFKSLS